MQEIWLASNRRIFRLAIIPVGLFGLLGLGIFAADMPFFTRYLGAAFISVAGILLVALIYQLRKPRIKYHEGQVLFFLKAGGPISVPVEAVEAFFLGQGPANLPIASVNETKTVNLITRLSRKYPEWQEREIKKALGKWEDGYITIRGIWSEPLDNEVIRRLNHRLYEVSRMSSGKTEVEESC